MTGTVIFVKLFAACRYDKFNAEGEAKRSYCFSFYFAGHCFCAFHYMIYMLCNAGPEESIHYWRASTHLQPGTNFFSAKQTELLFEIELKFGFKDGAQFLEIGLTSGSVSALPIAIIPGTRTPSVKTGPKKCCMFGVRRKGTTSLEMYIGGAWGAVDGANAVCIGEHNI